MATEVDVPESVPSVPDQPANTTPTFDESLLVRDAKGRPQPPKEPDRTERDLLLEKLSAECEKQNNRIQEIKAIIDVKRGSARGYGVGTPEINQRLKQCKDEFQSVLRQKQAVRNDRAELSKEREDIRNRLRAIRESVRGVRLDEVDSVIQELDYKLQHETLSANDEKALIAKLHACQQARAFSGEHAALTARLGEIDVAQNAIQQKLLQYDTILNDIKAREEKERVALSSIKNKEQEETSDIPTLQQEKNDCWEAIQIFRKKMDEIKYDFSKKMEEFKKLQRNHRNWENWDRKQKYEARKAEREARNKEREARYQEKQREMDIVDYDVQPFAAEIYLVDQLVVYLKTFVVEAKDAEAETAEAKELKAPEKGMKLLKRKDEEEYYTGGKGKKKPAKKVESKAAQLEKKSDRKLTHGLETLSTFMRLKIDVPQTVADIPKTIIAAEARKVHYLEMREAKKRGEPVPEANGDRSAESNGEGAGPSSVTLAEDGTVVGDENDKGETSGAAVDDTPDQDRTPNGVASDVGVTLNVDKAGDVAVDLKVPVY